MSQSECLYISKGILEVVGHLKVTIVLFRFEKFFNLQFKLGQTYHMLKIMQKKMM